MSAETPEVTLLLAAIERGDPKAPARLFPLIYEELHQRAGQMMARERKDHTLQRTALVHEAYLKLVGGSVSFESRRHFFHTAALAMRQILINHAEARGAQKRGGGLIRRELDDLDAGVDGNANLDAIALDEALKELVDHSPRQAEVVNLRFFCGLGDAEIAQMLNVSEKTVRRDWIAARVWLFDRMNR
jgi:RNA polymerase sigma factor (TIGR02999 family)